MAEKITGLGPGQVQVGRGRKTGSEDATGAAGTRVKQAGSGAETVRITETALRLKRLEEALANTPVADAERVKALKDAITNALYEVDAERVADKLISMERDLTGIPR